MSHVLGIQPFSVCKSGIIANAHTLDDYGAVHSALADKYGDLACPEI